MPDTLENKYPEQASIEELVEKSKNANEIFELADGRVVFNGMIFKDKDEAVFAIKFLGRLARWFLTLRKWLGFKK